MPGLVIVCILNTIAIPTCVYFAISAHRRCRDIEDWIEDELDKQEGTNKLLVDAYEAVLEQLDRNKKED